MHYPPMARVFPFSLILFFVTGAIFVLQTIPLLGIFLMLLMAPFWSVLLVNLGFIGIAIEAATGRVSRLWLILPVVFYGGYWVIAVQDRLVLRELAASYDAANARIVIGFNPRREAIAFQGEDNGAWLTQNYALPVSYSMNANVPEGYLAHRMIASSVCAKVRENPASQAAFVHTFGFHDDAPIAAGKMETRFCLLSMPEKPDLPLVRISRQEAKETVSTLPVTLVKTTISMPAGPSFQILGGFAAPLSWIPRPVMGCGLNSGAPSWNCGAGFSRDSFTPIASGHTRYRREAEALARALGLEPVAIEERRGGDPSLVLAKIATVEDARLARQLANIDAMILDPIAKITDWQTGVVASRPDVLSSRADAIMTGIERAAAVTGGDRYKAKDSGQILTQLLASLSRSGFVSFGPRILAVYAKADDEHWLWSADPLLRHLGEIGTDALPILTNPRVLRSPNGAGIEGLCRVGEAGRAASESALIAMWSKSRDGLDHDRRAAMFVAMRRIGITPPPLTDDKSNQLAMLETEWADVSSRSPSRVCATQAEWQARREERYGGVRRTNID